ncbi:hypothetical protein F5X68DRAFT_275695 [Plectosphaerella plurivora]|uniref:Uncharacterized protein n=1 Tax=Plectosphaerella plurivora TaxID=936078 RepID=A0A9P8VCZ9_9PEZI|nr:hypothetical protein F5X68DRAFT_275695 [Plectosphaerella plurivora]
MSVFSKIKRSRQQAKEHTQKEADKAKKEATHAPYRHVPTHAAIDALSGAPPSWKHDDRAKIVDLNRRRSAMAASGRDMRMPGPPSLAGLPRVASSLSHVSYPSLHANPSGYMPRAYSYTGVPPVPSWPDRGVDMMFPGPDGATPSLKGKELEKLPVSDSGRQSAASSKGETPRISTGFRLGPVEGPASRPEDANLTVTSGSPIGSSGDSSSSQDDLEIRPSANRRSTMPPHSVGMSPLHHTTASRPSAAATHRLHPSSRRASDASERGAGDPAVMVRAAAASAYDRRPPAAMHNRSYGPIPTSTPMSLGPETPVAASYAGSTSSQHSLSTAQASLASFNFGTVSTAPSSAMESAPISSKSSVSVPAPAATAQAAVPAVQADQLWEAALAQAQLNSESRDGPPTPKAKERRVSKAKVTRFTELETIDSNVEHMAFDGAIPAAYTITAAPPAPEGGKDLASKESAIRETVEEVSEPAAAAPKGRRLSKQPPGGAKPAKKSRWTSRSSSAVAV